MPVSDVRQTRARVTADRALDIDDAKAVLAAAGKSVSPEELVEVAKTLVPRGQYAMSTDATTFLQGEVRQLQELQSQATEQNAMVSARAPRLQAEEELIRKPGVTSTSFGGSVVPERVKQVLSAMMAAGATAYDVAELDTSIGRDDHDATQWALSGKWTPYPQEIEGNGPMAFSHTELTPEKIRQDMETERDQMVLVGYEQKTITTRQGKTTSWQEPKYEARRMKGTGNITATYDETSHPEPYALGQGPAHPKFSSNFAILADGSFHALPAMRRTPDQPNLILTNPSLARGKRMLFNGHIEMRGGVVTSIGLSGRLQKLVADGDAKIVDAVKLLEAWGFKVAPGLQVHMEGSGDVKVDAATSLIVEA